MSCTAGPQQRLSVCVFQGGWTALMWAAYKGRVEVTKHLLEHGANPNTTGQVTRTHLLLSDVYLIHFIDKNVCAHTRLRSFVPC